MNCNTKIIEEIPTPSLHIHAGPRFCWPTCPGIWFILSHPVCNSVWTPWAREQNLEPYRTLPHQCLIKNCLTAGSYGSIFSTEIFSLFVCQVHIGLASAPVCSRLSKNPAHSKLWVTVAIFSNTSTLDLFMFRVCYFTSFELCLSIKPCPLLE